MKSGAPIGRITRPDALARTSENAIALRTKLYVAVQLGITMAASLWVFIGREHHTWTLLLVSALLITWAMSSLCGLLDARPRARFGEGMRLLVTAVALVLFFAPAVLASTR